MPSPWKGPGDLGITAGHPPGSLHLVLESGLELCAFGIFFLLVRFQSHVSTLLTVLREIRRFATSAPCSRVSVDQMMPPRFALGFWGLLQTLPQACHQSCQSHEAFLRSWWWMATVGLSLPTPRHRRRRKRQAGRMPRVVSKFGNWAGPKLKTAGVMQVLVYLFMYQG